MKFSKLELSIIIHKFVIKTSNKNHRNSKNQSFNPSRLGFVIKHDNKSQSFTTDLDAF